MICHVSVAPLKLRSCTWARAHQWVVSARAINIHFVWPLKKISFFFKPEQEDDAQNWFVDWSGIVLEDIFNLEIWIPRLTTSHINIGRALNKDSDKMAKLFPDALLLIVSLLNIFTVGKCSN